MTVWPAIRWAVVACALFSLVAEPQSVQDLRDAQQERADARTQAGEAAIRVQQLQDQSVLDSRQREKVAEIARTQEEYREHIQDVYTAAANRGLPTHQRLGEIEQRTDPQDEGKPGPPPAPETVAHVSADPNAPYDQSDAAQKTPDDGQAMISPAPPVPPGPGDEDYMDQVQTHNRNAAIASEAAGTFGKSEPLPATAEQRASDARSVSGPAPPPVAGTPKQWKDSRPDPDAGTQPDAAAAAAWSQAAGVTNDGRRNDAEEQPKANDGNVRKWFADGNNAPYSVREPPHPPAPADPAVSERYHKQSVIATTGGNAAYSHPEDQQPVADNHYPLRVIKSKINGQATTSEPILENPDQHAEYVAPALEPDDNRPIEPTISVPANVTAAIKAEGDEWYRKHVESVRTHPGNRTSIRDNRFPIIPHTFKENMHKSIAMFGRERTGLIKERTTKYIGHTANVIRTQRERVKKKKILSDMRWRTNNERKAKDKETTIERAGKKFKQARTNEITAKERVHKPSAADQAAADKAEHDAAVVTDAEYQVTLKGIHDKERERIDAQEKKDDQDEAHQAGIDEQSKEFSLGDILAKDAYMASLRSHGNGAKALRKMATNLEMDARKKTGVPPIGVMDMRGRSNGD